MTDKPRKPVCRYCGSDDVTSDGPAYWSMEEQKWELADTYDSGHCNACDQEAKWFDWVEIKPEPTKEKPNG